jgi:hypothetical protein
MKKISKFIAPFALLMFLLIGNAVRADFPPPPPMPGMGHAYNGDVPAVPAPIDGGLSILLFLGAFYGVKKGYKAVKEEQ